MAVLPFFHIYGMNTIMNLTLYRRGTLVTMPKMELPTFLDLVQSRRVTYLYIAPPIAVALAKHPIVDDYDLPSIRRIRKADVEAGIKPGTTSAESRELREAKRRVRLLEQENEVLRRAAAYLSQANLPGKGGTRS